MALVSMRKLLDQAASECRGIGAFSVGNMEMAAGAVKAAEDMNTPIILQIAEVRLKHSPLELMGPMMLSAARNAKVDVAVHLDHGLTEEVVNKALNMGFTSVMYDSSLYTFEENIERTCRIRRLASAHDATVEAELGVVGGSEDGSCDHGIKYTDPEEASVFCEKTGVDALAVAVGNAHGNYKAAPKLAFDVIKEVRSRVPGTHLVLHGGSGISDEDFREAIRCGIVKVNIATASFSSLTMRAGEYFEGNSKPDYFGLNEAMVKGTYENVKHHIEVFNMV